MKANASQGRSSGPKTSAVSIRLSTTFGGHCEQVPAVKMHEHAPACPQHGLYGCRERDGARPHGAGACSWGDGGGSVHRHRLLHAAPAGQGRCGQGKQGTAATPTTTASTSRSLTVASDSGCWECVQGKKGFAVRAEGTVDCSDSMHPSSANNMSLSANNAAFCASCWRAWHAVLLPRPCRRVHVRGWCVTCMSYAAALVMQVHACEWNPAAVECLKRGLAANGVSDR